MKVAKVQPAKVARYLTTLEPRLADTNKKTRNHATSVFSDVVEVNPQKVAEYLDALEPRLADTNEYTRNFASYAFYKVSELDSSLVAQYEDALRPLRNDRNDNTQSFARITVSRIDDDSQPDPISSHEGYTEATGSKTDTGTTDTKIFDPESDDLS
jgi:hypothetical protein